MIIHIQSDADLVAGFDNLLLELADRVLNDLPDGLSEQHHSELRATIHREIAKAREAVEGCG